MNVHWLATLALSEELRNTMMAAGVLLLVAIFMLNIVRRARKAPEPTISPRERLERSKQIDGTKNDLRTMMVELEELSREFSAKLDAKSVQLRKEVREADERIAELQRLIEQAGGKPIPVGRPAPANPVEPVVVKSQADPLTSSVYELADAGHDAGEIAGKLGEHIGKVELILALRQA